MLTAGSDTGAAFTGGAGNDTYTSNVVQDGNGNLTDTLQGVDQLNGGGGIDTLNVTTKGNVAKITPSLTSIEVVNLRATTGAVELDLSASTGVTAVNVNNSSSVATVSSLGAASFGVANQNQNASLKGSTASALALNFDTVGTKTANITVDIAAGTANAATSFVVNAKDAYVTLAETTASAATTSATVAATGANKIAFAAADLASLKTLTVTGAGTADFTGGALTALTTLTAGDGGVKVTGTSTTATALTATTGAGADTLVFNGANVKSISTGAGNDAVTLNTGALAATATVSLGDGNDTVTLLGAASAAGATIDGGAGTDTFATTATIYGGVASYTPAQRALISNFEVLSITDTLANNSTFDVSALTGVGSFTAAAGVVTAGNATVNKLGANSTVTIAGNNVAVAQVSTVALSALTGTPAGTDTYSVTVAGTKVTTATSAYASIDAIGAALVTAIAANATVNPLVTATYSAGVLTLTDKAPGTGFTIAASGNEDAADASITVLVATPTPNDVGAAGSLTANLAADTTADAMTLVLNNNYIDNNDTTADPRAAANKFVVADVESLTVNSTGTIAPAIMVAKVDGYKADVLTNTLDLTGSNKLTSITVTGDQKLTLATTVAMTKLATIDASANTAGVVIDASLAAVTSPALTIKGTAKADTIKGGALGDTITLGGGNDTMDYTAGVSKIGTGKFDTITDFSANTYGNSLVTAGAAGTGAAADVTKWTGDVLKFDGNAAAVTAVVDVFTNAANATTFLANNANAANGIVAALDSSTGNLYIDNTADGVADFFISLTGVTTITAAAFQVV